MYRSLSRPIIEAAHEIDPELIKVETDLRNEIAQLDNSDDINIPLNLYLSRLAIAIYQMDDGQMVDIPQPRIGDRVAINLGDTYCIGVLSNYADDGIYVTPSEDTEEGVLVPWQSVNDILQRR
ncbi:MAG: hypothetical protein K6T81_03080 [Alicyclobacillus macrosporangiidus]|uniref:hypothetical protein n=1 Tax=Alicyclobacillus macrosporangiidus TaxID=392015 RepID=UPI0026EC7A4B|nr:hypothetical protein [Alicyclobacillus macrosporangiidus]MCL6597705.1 hypothetical protein [Alicyclobacillus macrosporangiidus]